MPWSACQHALQGFAAPAPLAAPGLALLVHLLLLLLLWLVVPPLLQQQVLPSPAPLQHLQHLLLVLPCRLKQQQQTPCACSAPRP
jgi:hypothetical protein